MVLSCSVPKRSLRWILPHTNIPGNVGVDKLAKGGSHSNGSVSCFLHHSKKYRGRHGTPCKWHRKRISKNASPVCIADWKDSSSPPSYVCGPRVYEQKPGSSNLVSTLTNSVWPATTLRHSTRSLWVSETLIWESWLVSESAPYRITRKGYHQSFTQGAHVVKCTNLLPAFSWYNCAIPHRIWCSLSVHFTCSFDMMYLFPACSIGGFFSFTPPYFSLAIPLSLFLYIMIRWSVHIGFPTAWAPTLSLQHLHSLNCR